jgi:hypothetical protein
MRLAMCTRCKSQSRKILNGDALPHTLTDNLFNEALPGRSFL